MRLAGKTLRYAMEVFELAFGEDFRTCLEEVKRILDAMGRIHDCDVNAPKLQDYLREMRLYNRTISKPGETMPTGAIVKMIQEQFAFRRSLFAEMSAILERWRRENFKGKVLQSMMVPP